MSEHRLFGLCLLVSACLNAAFWSATLGLIHGAPFSTDGEARAMNAKILMLALPQPSPVTTEEEIPPAEAKPFRPGAGESVLEAESVERTVIAPAPKLPKDEPEAWLWRESLQERRHYVEVPPEFAPDPLPLEDTNMVGVRPTRAKDTDISTDRLTDQPRMIRGRWPTHEMQEVPFIAPLLPPEKEAALQEAIEAITPEPSPDTETSHTRAVEAEHEPTTDKDEEDIIPEATEMRFASAPPTATPSVERTSGAEDHVSQFRPEEEASPAVFSPEGRVLAMPPAESTFQPERREPKPEATDARPEVPEPAPTPPSAISARRPPNVLARSESSQARPRTSPGGLFRGEIMMDRLPAPLHHDPVANAVLYGNETFNIKPDRYAPYYKYVRDHIGRYWFTMMASFYAQRGYMVERIDYVVIRFTIRRDGIITDVRTITGSQDPVFESICLRSIQTARLAPLPSYVTEPELRIIFNFARPWP